MQWLAVSLVLSVVLTVLLNVALRAFPGAGEQLGRKLADLADRRPEAGSGVFVPWKAMIVVSVVLTVALNLLLWVWR